MTKDLKKQFFNYLIAISITTAAVLLRLSLDPILGQTLILVTIYGAVAFSAWYCGYKPTLLVTFAGYAACNYLFMDPKGIFHLDKSQFVGFLAYLITCAILIALGEGTRIANQRYKRKELQHLLSESELKASEKRRQRALDSAELGAWNFDLQSGILTTDERFNLIFTGETSAKTYQEILSYIHPDDRNRVVNAMEEATNPYKLKPYISEYRVVRSDGSIHWIYARGALNFDDIKGNRAAVSLDGTISDITERKRIEEHLAQQSAELSEIDRRKNQFIATLAHELRNPLSPIRNSLSIMKIKGYETSVVERSTLVIERQVTQLVRLVDDLLDVSRISHGKLELKLEDVELHQIINMAEETSLPLLNVAGVEFTKSIPSSPIYLQADLTRLSQVVLNILNNAAKFTNRGGRVHLNVKLVPSLTSNNSDDVEISISDTGVGIATESLPLVFEAFSQLPETKNRAQGGLGVGLMLVKRLVAMHGGTVKVHSGGLGLGTTFTLQLPTIFFDSESNNANVTHISKNDLSDHKRALRVLVVDDNVDAALSMSMLLETMGNETLSVHDGLSALKAYVDYKPDLVFLDIGLPDISGYEVASKIRQLPSGKSIKLFALSGWGQTEDQQKSEQAGFDKHFVKPIDPSIISKLLETVKST